MEEIQDSKNYRDVLELGLIKTHLQEIQDQDDKDAAINILAKFHIKDDKPTQLFCSIIKKRRRTTQFDTLIRSVTDKEGKATEVVLEGQEDIAEKLCRIYERLYVNRKVEHIKDEILYP